MDSEKQQSVRPNVLTKNIVYFHVKQTRRYEYGYAMGSEWVIANRVVYVLDPPAVQPIYLNAPDNKPRVDFIDALVLQPLKEIPESWGEPLESFDLDFIIQLTREP
jgi:hypothetical protein